MDISAIRVRYAKAFFSLAKEKNMTDVLKTDIELVFNICKQSSEFILLLESPVVSTSKKAELISKIFNGIINPLTLSFLLLIVNNKREVYIPGICFNFLEFIRKEQNIKSAILITATEISSNTINKVKSIIEKELDVKVELECNVNPKIIGGLILRIDDKQFDSSVTTQLKKIKQQLIDSEVKN